MCFPVAVCTAFSISTSSAFVVSKLISSSPTAVLIRCADKNTELGLNWIEFQP
ncbi:hypothetical protein [Prosthecobacter sp.]